MVLSVVDIKYVDYYLELSCIARAFGMCHLAQENMSKEGAKGCCRAAPRHPAGSDRNIANMSTVNQNRKTTINHGIFHDKTIINPMMGGDLLPQPQQQRKPSLVQRNESKRKGRTTVVSLLKPLVTLANDHRQ